MQDLLGTSAALMAAQQVSLLLSLLEGPGTAGEHARRRAVDPRATERVLDVLVAVGLAHRDGDSYTASTELREAAARLPGGLGFAVALWGRTPTFLRTGEPYLRVENAADREVAYRNLADGLGRLFGGSARELAERLDFTPASILDIGCGAGTWGLAAAERFAGARVTGLDLPAVAATFAARAAELGMAERAATIAGDVHGVDIPARAFDLVLCANVLRLETAERAAHIVERAAGAVAPGGRLVIVDALSDGTPERERARAVYALHLAMRSREGRVHSSDEIRRWIEAHGLRPTAELTLGGPTTLGAIVAVAPADAAP